VADALVDTDVLVDHLRGVSRLAGGRSLRYSVITRCELFAGREEEERIRLLLAPMGELPVDREIAELAGRLRRMTAIRIPDALIAATALTARLPLLTRNRRHFERVPELELAVL
jgi:predicted nucleic acid-binding protein